MRNPRELDDHRPSPVPEVRAMSTANTGLEPRGDRVGSEPLLADSQEGRL